MGVTGLTSFMKNSVPRGYEKIDILLEIEKFKLENDCAQPAIIFDVMGFIHSFTQTNDECILGGRHNVYIDLATNFFEQLTECGAKLVFFCDGQLQQNRINVWCSRKDREYTATMAILSEIDADKYRCSDRYGHSGSKYFVNSLLETAKRFGPVIVATEHDCDAMTAQYATRNNALAIVASDSDYLIYEGNWQHWHVDTLDMKRFSVKRFNRNALTGRLRLNRGQMKVFATIAGNDYVKRGHPYQQDFRSIADFCRTLTVTTSPNEMVYRKIADYISNGGNNQNTIRSIKLSIESYDINFELVTDADNLELYVRENVLMHAILNDGIFQYQANYVDLSAANNNNNNKESYLENILSAMRRLAGVLLHDKKAERGSFKLVTKHSLETKYELTHEMPEYPPLEMPTLNDLIFGENDLDSTRWKLMLWTLNCKEQLRGELLRIPNQLKMVVMAIVFLREASAISLIHADALLVTEYTLNGLADPSTVKNDTKPTQMYGDIVRAAQIYNRTMLLIWDCFVVCGLQRFISNSYFDGFLFHNLCVEFRASPTEYGRKKNSIKDFRLYAEPHLDRVP